MKLLLIAAVFTLTLLQQGAAPSPRNAGQEGSQNTKQDTESSQKIPNPPPPAIKAGDTNAAPNAPDQNASPIATQDKEQNIRIAPPITANGDKTKNLNLWFDGILAFVGVIGIVVAICTLVTIRHQTEATRIAADATEKSVTLQETALRQWVGIENWRATPLTPESGDKNFHVQFDVVNPTTLPLTLQGVFVKIGEQDCTIQRKQFIPPRKMQPVTMQIKVTDEQLSRYTETFVAFMVVGHVFFQDVLEKDRNQLLSGAIQCFSGGRVEFIPPYGAGLYIYGKKEK